VVPVATVVKAAVVVADTVTLSISWVKDLTLNSISLQRLVNQYKLSSYLTIDVNSFQNIKLVCLNQIDELFVGFLMSSCKYFMHIQDILLKQKKTQASYGVYCIKTRREFIHFSKIPCFTRIWQLCK
jgi:hypothetical protein